MKHKRFAAVVLAAAAQLLPLTPQAPVQLPKAPQPQRC